MLYKKVDHSCTFKTIGFVITLFFFIDCTPIILKKPIAPEAQQTAKQLIDSIVVTRDFIWQLQHFGTLKCQPEEIGIYLQRLTSKEFIKKYRDHEHYSAKEYHESQYWFNSIEVCLILLQYFPVPQNVDILVRVIKQFELFPHLVRKAILALGSLNVAKKYIEQLAKSENDFLRASAIEAQILCLISENNYSEIEKRNQQYEMNLYTIWKGNKPYTSYTYKLIGEISSLLSTHRAFLTQKTPEGQIRFLLGIWYELVLPGVSPRVKDTLMAKASLFEFKKLLRSNQSQVLAVLRKIADEERKIPRTTLQPNSLYIMRDFGLPMTDAEKEEFTKDITPTMDIWRPLFIPPLCQEVESH